MESFENTVANNAGIAKRSIQRMFDLPVSEIYEAFNKAGVDLSDLEQLEEAVDTLIALASLNDDPMEEDTALETGNQDGFLFNEYHEYDL
tara:strand:- start:344 stop:613 length:270 start_codon:yes stop_codon:yes gene_type:complete